MVCSNPQSDTFFGCVTQWHIFFIFHFPERQNFSPKELSCHSELVEEFYYKQKGAAYK